jgi:hypothetical protein
MPMAARKLVPETPGQTEAMFPKLNGGQIAQLAASSGVIVNRAISRVLGLGHFECERRAGRP